MKQLLWCRIFGHKFVRIVRDIPTGTYSSIVIKEATNKCVNCGLSKSEINKLEGAK